jgi:hypothetical protein
LRVYAASGRARARASAWLSRASITNYVLTGPDVGAGSHWAPDRDRYLLERACRASSSAAASAVGEGSLAIAFVHQYLRETGTTSTDAVAAASTTTS